MVPKTDPLTAISRWALAIVANSASVVSLLLLSTTAQGQQALQPEQQRAQKRYADPPVTCPGAAREDIGLAGQLLDHGLCLVQQADSAGAMDRFGEVLTLSKDARTDEQLAFARQWIEHLRSKVAKLTLKAEEPASGASVSSGPVRAVITILPGRESLRTVNPGELGQEQILNPGSYEIEVIRGKTPLRKKTVCLSAGQALTVDLLSADAPVCSPHLCSDVAAQATETCPEQPPCPAAKPCAPVRSAPAGAPNDFQQKLSIGAGAAGLAVLGLSAYLGWQSNKKADDSERYCENDGDPISVDPCEPRGLELGNEAKGLAWAANAGFLVGGSLALGGVLLWLTAPSAAGEDVAFVPVLGTDTRRLLVQGRW